MKKEDGKEAIEIWIDLDLYCLEAAYATAYAFLDESYFYLRKSEDSNLIVEIKPKQENKKSAEEIKKNFLNELLYASMRHNISRNNQKVRENIVGTALASGIKADESCSADGSINEKEIEIPWKNKEADGKSHQPIWVKDPDGIAVPWEEKYGKAISPSEANKGEDCQEGNSSARL
jgi:His-Xaa-Ser system protein HxsD